MREELKKKLAVLCNRDDLAHIESLLDREGGFCLAGQMAIVDMIIDLQEYLTIEEMLKHCEAEWAQNWGLQAPSVRGSPAAEGNIGIQNIVAVETFYFAYQLTSQLIGIPVEVPDGPFNVATRSSVYRFGEAGFAQERSVSCSTKELGFETCIVQEVVLGKPVIVEYDMHTPRHNRWQTTPIIAFVPAPGI